MLSHGQQKQQGSVHSSTVDDVFYYEENDYFSLLSNCDDLVLCFGKELLLSMDEKKQKNRRTKSQTHDLIRHNVYSVESEL